MEPYKYKQPKDSKEWKSPKTLYFNPTYKDGVTYHQLSNEEISKLENYCSDQDISAKDLEKYQSLNLMEKLSRNIICSLISEEIEVYESWDPVGPSSRVYDLVEKINVKAKDTLKNIVGYPPDTESYNDFLFPILIKDYFENIEDFNYEKFMRWWDIEFKTFWERFSPINKSETSFKGVELNSPPHKKLCEKLEAAGLMFFFEAPCYLLGDEKSHRRIDLVVINKGMAVIVEIDGGHHRTVKQKRDDDERDRLIQNNFTNYLRFDAAYVLENTDEVFNKIMARINPDTGKIC